MVDQTADPEWFVRFLDTTRAKKRKKANAHPEQYFAYLDLKPGHHVLELGCGTGEFLSPMAKLVGETGRLVGLDKSELMIEEARKRATDPMIEFVIGDVHRLDFADKSFDRCFTTTLFQHLANPQAALKELVRVTRPGGKIAVTEQDWDTLIINSENKEITRKILNSFCDGIPNGRIGRELTGLFNDAGLGNVDVTTATFTSTDIHWTEQTLGLAAMVSKAEQSNVITNDEGTRWLAELDNLARHSKFFAAFTAFCVVGSKPGPSYY
jgi:ubiquinone/menaquinone biosynthesis C-methylase UbiE